MTHIFLLNYYSLINLINVHVCMQQRSSQDGPKSCMEMCAYIQGMAIITADHLKMMEIIGRKTFA